jgi:hypothetical protein
MMKSHVIPNVCSEYSEHYFRDYQSVIPKSTYPIAWSYYNFLSSHWLAIWCIFRRSPLSEENYPNRNPAWKQALLTIDFQGNTRKGSSTSLSTVKRGRANAQLSTEIFYTLAVLISLDRFDDLTFCEFTLPHNRSNLIN